MDAPARLDGRETAAATWRRLMREFAGIEGEIVTRLDMDLLIDYCLLMDQLVELDQMRKSAKEIWEQLDEARKKSLTDGDLVGALSIATKVNYAFDNIVKLDSRADRKRALLFQMKQSLYLTPRARAGVAPARKEEPVPPDDLEMLLNEANEAIKGNGQ